MSIAPTHPLVGTHLDVQRVRTDFPALHQDVRGKRLVYLDNAASTQKPVQVLDAVRRYYEHDNANVHRGVHALSERATVLFEEARERISQYLNAEQPHEVIFVRGATEAINLVASTFGHERVRAGDEVIISAVEHHSNLVPWQVLCARANAQLRVLPLTPGGEVNLDDLRAALNHRTKLVAISHVSNALGSHNDIKKICALAHAVGVPVLVDGAQAAAHGPVDVRDLDCDFYAMSGHKVYGPMGIGVLYGKTRHLLAMPPYQFGGEMISRVGYQSVEFNELPFKFEAGTPNVAGAIGLAAALDYVDNLGWDRIQAHEQQLISAATRMLSEIEQVQIIGSCDDRKGVVSFLVEGVHPHDVATLLDSEGVAIRAGHHCCQPLMDSLGMPGTARASFAVYNTLDEVERLAAAIRNAVKMFA